MGKKIKIYESEIKRATRRKLMENYLEEEDNQEMSGAFHRRDFSPTPREKDVMSVFGDMYGEDIPPVVIRYIRKNPDHIMRRLAKIYPDIYMRHVPLQSNVDLEMEDDILDEEEQINVTQYDFKDPDDIKKLNDKLKSGVDPTKVTIGSEGGQITSESTKDLFKRFLNKK